MGVFFGHGLEIPQLRCSQVLSRHAAETATPTLFGDPRPLGTTWHHLAPRVMAVNRTSLGELSGFKDINQILVIRCY